MFTQYTAATRPSALPHREYQIAYSAEPYQALPSCPGIYAIYVVGAPGVYVGQAMSLRDRWITHVSSMRHRKRSNPILRQLAGIFPLTAFYCEPLSLFDHLVPLGKIERIDLDVFEGAWVHVFARMGFPLYNTRPTSPERTEPPPSHRRVKGSVVQINPENVRRTHTYHALVGEQKVRP